VENAEAHNGKKSSKPTLCSILSVIEQPLLKQILYYRMLQVRNSAAERGEEKAMMMFLLTHSKAK